MRHLLLVPVTAAWAVLRPGTIVFELSALMLAALITLELAEAKGWDLPSWVRRFQTSPSSPPSAPGPGGSPESPQAEGR